MIPSKFVQMENTDFDQPSFWTGILDIKILICLHVENEVMKVLVLVNKEISEICSSEYFYRMRIIKDFNVDLVDYMGEVSNYTGANTKQYRIAYRALSNLSIKVIDPNYWFNRDLIKIGDGKTISWYTFEYACVKGYISIIKQASRNQMLQVASSGADKKVSTPEDLEKEYTECITEVAEGVFYKGNWDDVVELLVKEFELPLQYISWNIMINLSGKGAIEGYKKWIAKGLDLGGDTCATALREATRNGYSDLAIFLIENGTVLHPSEYVEDWPPIIYAVKYCSVKVVKMMVERGQNIHWDDDMIFKKDIWKGADRLEANKPTPEMLEYLSGIQELTWLGTENTDD